jgi:signal transduction histidine kinase
LTLARTLVEQHGGQISAHSDGPGRGSEFRVMLPVLDEMPSARVTTH